MSNRKRIRNTSSIYHEKANEIAIMIGQLQDMKSTFESLMNQEDDCGDPYFDSSLAIENLGVLLASVVVYEHEYEEKANAGNSKANN